MESLLSIDNLGVSYGEKPILEEVDLEVHPAEIFGLMGPGGAGKSTLLNVLARSRGEMADFAVRGAVRYEGGALDDERRPALVGQTLGLISSTLFEYLATNDPERSQKTRRQLKDRYGRLLERYGLGGLKGRYDQEVVVLDRFERVLLALVRTTLSDPQVIFVDEPMAGCDEEGAERILELLEQMRLSGYGIVLVSHHQKRVRRVADRIGLLAGGRIREVAPTEEFFEDPQTEEAQRYVRTGHCDVPSLNAQPEELADAGVDEEAEVDETESVADRRASYQRKKTTDGERAGGAAEPSGPTEAALEPADQFKPARVGPRNFHWVVEGRLGGTPRPGGVAPIERDLAALKRLELTTLVTLKLDKLQEEAVESSDLEVLHFPIVDMKTPELAETAEFLADLTGRILAGGRVALHCEAGIGRTGTMLACYLIYHGFGGAEALEYVRGIYHRYVQSVEQEEFLLEFEQFRAGEGAEA